jgi:kynurenine formamidase
MGRLLFSNRFKKDAMTIIDLSQSIYEGMKVYPGHLKTVQFEHATHEETSPRFEGEFSFQTTGLLMNDNGPTHVDSFSHLDPDPAASTIETMPLDLFYGTAVCLDISGFSPGTDITWKDLDRVEAASPIAVQEDDIVLFYTATWNRHGGTREYLSEFPGLGTSGSEWIVGRRVKTFGVDTPTPDNPVSQCYPCHMMCRREHITHYENLANLDKVVNTRFTFAGFPLKIQAGHGGPTRAVALIQ